MSEVLGEGENFIGSKGDLPDVRSRLGLLSLRICCLSKVCF
jgi:hypothetical protein